MSKAATKRKRPGGWHTSHEEWLASPAYRSLSLVARCLLTEFQRIHRPSRNGHLSISVENAAKLLNVSANTARKGFYELAERGFLALRADYCYTKGKATEYRLTIEPYNGREPTDDWREWQPGKPVWSLSRRRPKKQKATAKSEPDQRNNCTGPVQNLRLVAGSETG